MINKDKRSLERDRLLQIANARLHPSLTDPSFLVLRSRRLNFTRWINQLTGRSLVVLDVGGRYQPYRSLFQDRTLRYVGVDILQTEMVDVVGSGESLPFAANSFDVVIATQVFEYFLQPRAAAEQIYSVLKPGGSLLMSVASFAPRFVDEERWRFTPEGLRFFLSSFSKLQIVPETYSVGGLVRAFNVGLLSFSHFQTVRRIVELSLVPLINLAGLALEKGRFTTNDQFTPNYSIRATKAG